MGRFAKKLKYSHSRITQNKKSENRGISDKHLLILEQHAFKKPIWKWRAMWQCFQENVLVIFKPSISLDKIWSVCFTFNCFPHSTFSRSVCLSFFQLLTLIRPSVFYLSVSFFPCCFLSFCYEITQFLLHFYDTNKPSPIVRIFVKVNVIEYF